MDNLELVRQHVSKANGLPNEHYITQSMFDEEKNSIIFNQWAGLDVCSEIPKIGDAKPLNFMGLPLFIIRDTQNAVRVYQNTCRHRGMILVDKPKKYKGLLDAHIIAGAIQLKANWSAHLILADQDRIQIRISTDQNFR